MTSTGPRNTMNGVPLGEPGGLRPALQADLKGRTVLLVGSTTGIGLETAKHFARMGPKRLIVTGRNAEKCKVVEQAVRDETGFAAVEAWPLELASLASVKAFVSRFNEDGGDLNLIVENAGIATREYNLTMDGYEETLQVNHLAGALLGVLLLPRLLETAKKNGTISRLVIVSSGTHHRCGFMQQEIPSDVKIFEHMSTEKFCVSENGMGTRYPDSKLINVLFARALQAHIPSSAPIVISAVDPGLCHSDLRRRIGESHMTELLKRARTAEEGSRQLLYASLGPDATNLDSTELTQPLRGGYVEDQEASSPSPWATSEDGAKLQARIWNETWELINKVDSRVAGVTEILRK